MRFPALGLLVLPLLVSLGACDGKRQPLRPTAPSADQAPVPTPPPSTHYSPFVVSLESQAPFSSIAFKDVGMSLSHEELHRVFESIAESLSLRLADNAELAMSSSVSYQPEVTKAENHVLCMDRHIYVDLWSSTETWGYSLWSGCGEDDQFGWKQLENRAPDMLARVDVLTRDIADSLQDAIRTGCFQKKC